MNNTINQMFTNIKKVVFITLAVVFLIPAVSFAEPSVSDSGNAAVSAPGTTDHSNAAVPASTPGTTDHSNAVVTNATPATTDYSNAGVSNPTPTTTDHPNAGVTNQTPGTTDHGNAVVTTPPATNPTTPSAPSGGGGGCISGCSSGGGSGFISSGSSVSVIAISGTPSCSYLNSYLTMGGENNPAEVTKLQNFLKNIEKIDVDVTGIFDTKTVDAVKAFQTKYSNETLAPWGVTTPTGQVFYTTKKKINEVYCKSTIALTAGELSGIEAYKNSVKNGIVETETTNPAVGSNESTPNSQTASAGSTSFAGKVWGFVKWLFGY